MVKRAIQFGGGKDGLAALLMSRPLDDAVVLFADTGDSFPHIRQFVEDTCDRLGVELIVARPANTIAAFQDEFGLPSDILPLDASIYMTPFTGAVPVIQPSIGCCSAMRWNPLMQAVIASGATTVIRGVKKCDTRKGLANGYTQNGITFDSPIWDWSDADVFAYLEREGFEPPRHYRDGAMTSFDCVHCTAYLSDDHAIDRLTWTREHLPEKWPELQRRLGVVRSTLDTELRRIMPALALGQS